MELLIPALTAFLISIISTPIVAIFAKKFGFTDDPKKRKHPAIIHKKIIPRAGGVVLWLSIIIPIVLFVKIDRQIVGLILGATIAVIVGTLDDKYDIPPIFRLLSNFLIAILVVVFGFSTFSITNPLGGIVRFDTVIFQTSLFGSQLVIYPVGAFFAIIWITWVMNMVNWSKGVDGQMPGIVVIAAIILAIVSLKFLPSDPRQLVVAKIAFIVAFSTLGFLIYNVYPAKIFPGYGATILGFFLATLAILASGKLATAILVLFVPFIDGAITIGRRLYLKKSPLAGDRAHLHHLLLSYGFSQRKIALFYWTACAILGMLSVFLKSIEKLFVVVVFGIIITGGLIWLNYLQLGKKEY